MARDEQGNLKPLMLSDLLKSAAEAMSEHGDMPVGIYTLTAGHFGRNEEYSGPASDIPKVANPRWMDEYWPGRFDKAFVIDNE